MNPSLNRAALYVSLALFAAHAALYLSFLPDDALISLQYARRLVAGYGLTWTDGAPVEGYSNLLWVLLVAAGGHVGFDLIWWAKALGLGLMLSVPCVIWSLLQKRDAAWNWTVGLVFASLGTLAAWASGALEQALLAALLAAGLVSIFRALETTHEKAWWVWAGLCFGLLCLTRPDAPLLIVAPILVAYFCGGSERPTVREFSPLLAIPFACVVAQALFRWNYYGALVPNTAAAKLIFSGSHLLHGFRYVWRGLAVHSPIIALALWGFWLSFRARRAVNRGTICVSVAILWLCYLVLIGGDVNPPLRHFVPVLVVALIGCTSLANELSVDRSKRAVARLVVPALVFLQAAFSFINKENIEAMTAPLGWFGKPLALTMNAAWRDERPLLAIDNAGTFAYFTDFPLIDLLGLNDSTIASRNRSAASAAWIGHGLGDPEYVLKRAPDIVIFCSPYGGPPCWPGGRALVAQAEFNKHYRQVRIKTAFATEYVPTPYVSNVWMSIDSTKVGIHRDGTGTTHIPGYFAEGAEGIVAELRPDNRLAVRLRVGEEIKFQFFGMLGNDVDVARIESDCPMSFQLTDGVLLARALAGCWLDEIRF